MNDDDNANLLDNYSSEQKPAKKIFVWWKFILFFLTYLGVQTAILIGPIIYLALSEVINDEVGKLDAFLASPWIHILDFVAFLIAILIFKSTRHFLMDAFSFQPLKKLSTYLYLIGAFIFMMATQYLIIDILGWDDASGQIETFGFDQLTFDWWTVTILMLGMAILTPIKEEVLFRGVLHGYLSDRWHFSLGLIISSVIFGLLHLGYPISATIMGITFVVLYKLTRSLIVPIILHAVWNGYAVISMIMYMNSL